MKYISATIPSTIRNLDWIKESWPETRRTPPSWITFLMKAIGFQQHCWHCGRGHHQHNGCHQSCWILWVMSTKYHRKVVIMKLILSLGWKSECNKGGGWKDGFHQRPEVSCACTILLSKVLRAWIKFWLNIISSFFPANDEPQDAETLPSQTGTASDKVMGRAQCQEHLKMNSSFCSRRVQKMQRNAHKRFLKKEKKNGSTEWWSGVLERRKWERWSWE